MYLLHAKCTIITPRVQAFQHTKSLRKAKKKCKWGRCERQEAVGSLVHVFHSQHHRHRGARDHSKVSDYQIHEIGRRHVVRQVEEAERGHILPVLQVGLSCTAHDEVVRVIWEKINTHGEFIQDENKIKPSTQVNKTQKDTFLFFIPSSLETKESVCTLSQNL